MKEKMFENVRVSIEKAIGLSSQIAEERKIILKKISDYIVELKGSAENINLLYICTHNSRRSHMGQVWGQVMADYYGISNVMSFSGGTEATACHPNTLEAFKAQGFTVNSGKEDNPLNVVSYSEQLRDCECWSKEYSDPANPTEKFCAIMTCSSADNNCPVVMGCDVRVACTYNDPKASDGTPEQDETYLARSFQIASEMAWVMKQASGK